MRQWLVEADLRTDAIGIPGRQTQPQILIPAIAAAQQHERAVEPRQFVGEVGDQVESLLIDKPRDQSDERLPKRGVGRRQLVTLEQRALRAALAIEMRRVVLPRD